MHGVWSLSVCVCVLGLAALGVQATVVLENGFPILWEQASSQLSDLPQVDNVVTVDPWNYRQRMSLYRLLLNATEQYMSCMGTNVTGSPLWGLPMQLGWKLRSGRLLDPTGASLCGHATGDNMCISGLSWWACVNYQLSVIPFLAAVQKGVIGDGLLQVQLQVPSDAPSEYCTSYLDCSAKQTEPLAKWEAFFQGLRDVSVSPITDFEKRDRILGLMWEAQLASLKQASFSCKEKLNQYSSPEKSFADSWLNSARFVGITHFQSNMARSLLFMSPLPSRVLQEGDSAPNIADLGAEENRILAVFGWMTNMNRFLGDSLRRLWKSAMCSAKARQKGQQLLQDMVLDPSFSLSGIFSIIREISTSC